MSDRRTIPGPVRQAVADALQRGVERDVAALLRDAKVKAATEYHLDPSSAVRRALADH